MSYSNYSQSMAFNFEGQFLGFVSGAERFKYLRLKVLSEEMQIKVPKELRIAIGVSLQPGASIQVQGSGKFDRSTQAIKLKATQINLCSPSDQQLVASPPAALPIQPKLNPPKLKVSICQKSGCLKKGGKGLCEALAKTLRDRKLDQYVTIERTGCMKRCSAAPNVVISPGNRRYTKVCFKSLSQISDEIALGLTE